MKGKHTTHKHTAQPTKHASDTPSDTDTSANTTTTEGGEGGPGVSGESVEGEGDDDEGPEAHEPYDGGEIELEVLEEEDLDTTKGQYVTLAASDIMLTEVDADGKRVHKPDPNPLRHIRPDGYIYVGLRSFKQVEACQFIVTDRLSASYITTAALRRSGHHPDYTDDDDTEHLRIQSEPEMEALRNCTDLSKWIGGDDKPDSTILAGCKVSIENTRMLHANRPTATVDGHTYIVVPGNEMKVIVGYRLVNKVDMITEEDESPLQAYGDMVASHELRKSLDELGQQVDENNDLSQKTKDAVARMLKEDYKSTWRTKYDLQQPAELPPMEIKLKPGAVPQKIRRHYRWTKEQRDFLAKLIRKLINTGVISRVDSEWCCPVVLVINPDKTWRLCVDPSALKKTPFQWCGTSPKQGKCCKRVSRESNGCASSTSPACSGRYH